MTLASMTGFARSEGASASPTAWTWAWELRSVNGRGLELRFRLPGGFDALEPTLRDLAGKHLVGLAFVALRFALSHTENRGQTCLQRSRDLVRERLVGLAEQLTPLRVTQHHQ
jgi:hypothetical protein